MFGRTARVLCIALQTTLLLSTACDHYIEIPKDQIPEAGEYVGFVRFSASAAAAGIRAGAQRAATAEWTSSSERGPFLLRFKEESDSTFPPLEVRVDRKGTQLRWALLGPQPLSLQPQENGCFRGNALRACWSKTEIELTGELPDGRQVELTLGRRDSEPFPTLEPPADFTPQALSQRAIEQSFESRIQFQRATQSRLNAQAAYLQLLPHLSYNSILGFVNFDAMSFVRMAGDLLPFLFPARWIRADAAKHLARADEYAFRLMRVDTGLVAETLSWSMLRDQDAVEHLHAERVQVARLRDQLIAKEKLGMVAPGTSDDLQALVGQIDLSISLLQGTIETNLTALSQVGGFMNPLAVRSVQLPEALRVQPPEVQDLETAQQLALSRSLELRQVDELIREAKDRRVGRWLNWLDPAGESAGAIGIGLLPYIEASSAQIEELRITREKLQELMLRKVTNTWQNLASAARAHEIATSDSEVQSRRLDRLMNQLRLGYAVSIPELVTALQGKLRNALDLSSSRFTWAAATAALDRQLYRGHYESVPGMNPPLPKGLQP